MEGLNIGIPFMVQEQLREKVSSLQRTATVRIILRFLCVGVSTQTGIITVVKLATCLL